MNVCSAVQLGVPYIARGEEQSKTSLYMRIAATAFGAIALAVGIMALVNVPAISALGVAGGAAFAAAGGLLLLGALLIKCVKQSENSEDPLIQNPREPNFTMPGYRADGNYTDRNGYGLVRHNLKDIIEGKPEGKPRRTIDFHNAVSSKLGRDLQTQYNNIWGNTQIEMYFDEPSSEIDQQKMVDAIAILLKPREELLRSEFETEFLYRRYANHEHKPKVFEALCARLLLESPDQDYSHYSVGTVGALLDGRSAGRTTLIPHFFAKKDIEKIFLEATARPDADFRHLLGLSRMMGHFQKELLITRLRELSPERYRRALNETLKEGEYSDAIAQMAFVAWGPRILNWEKVSYNVLAVLIEEHGLFLEKSLSELSIQDFISIVKRLKGVDSKYQWELLEQLPDEALRATNFWEVVPQEAYECIFSDILTRNRRVNLVPEPYQTAIKEKLHLPQQDKL